MNISHLISKKMIKIGIDAEEKNEIIKELVLFATENSNYIRNEKKLLKAIIEREKKSSTAIGLGIAIPHGRTFEARDFFMVLGISKEGKDFNAIDNQPVHLFFLMSAPPDNDTKYLKVIRELSESLRSDKLREKLINADNPDKAFFLLKDSW
jgi:PTS system fructose-specific IIC component